MSSVCFIDLEVSPQTEKVLDYGFVTDDGASLHKASPQVFFATIVSADFLCGHNIVDHDSRFIKERLEDAHIDADRLIDTLPLSPLLFPKRPYHALLKNEKFFSDEPNNPRNDAQKAKDLFYDEVNAFEALDPELQKIYGLLLSQNRYFQGFFRYMNKGFSGEAEESIRGYFSEDICGHAPLGQLISDHPCELAYCLANIQIHDRFSIFPRWVVLQFPDVNRVMHLLRGKRCEEGCKYCRNLMDPVLGLKRFFGYSEFRTFNGEPLQEKAVNAAINGKSLLAIFPTGGGKSITFQVPALINGETEKALTVVISPLQSLMKDQVDNLNRAGIQESVTINGMVDPIERAIAIEQVADGSASILYISPESLRSKTIEHLLLSRKIARFVIDLVM